MVAELTRGEHFSTLFQLMQLGGPDAAPVARMAWDLLMQMPTDAQVLQQLNLVR